MPASRLRECPLINLYTPDLHTPLQFTKTHNMAGTASNVDHHKVSGLFKAATLDDDAFQRGRKRRRSSDGLMNQPTAHNPSGGSTTLRGRGRRRSASEASSRSDNTTKPRTRSASPPGRKYQKKAQKVDFEKKRRSQSPSRSRSRKGDGTPRRRRQRTASRSRSHGVEKGGLGRQRIENKGRAGYDAGDDTEKHSISG